MHYVDIRVCGRGGEVNAFRATCISEMVIFTVRWNRLSLARRGRKQAIVRERRKRRRRKETRARRAVGPAFDPYVRMHAYIYYTSVCVCVPCAFLRLQFELKKTVDTRTIGCAAAAVVVVAVAAAGSSLSRLLLLSSYLPFKPATLLLASISLLVSPYSPSARWRCGWGSGRRCTSCDLRHALLLVDQHSLYIVHPRKSIPSPSPS